MRHGATVTPFGRRRRRGARHGRAWDKFELSADEFLEQGDTVVVLGHTDLAKSERSERLPVVHISRYRGDEEICRLQILTDTLQSARILGIA